MSDDSYLLGRRALGRNLLRTAALLGLRTVGGAQLVSAASLLGACGDDAASLGNGLDSQDVPLTYVEAETVVVGTGYGGAVVAKRLSEKGQNVLMLEMGRLWNQPGADGKVFCSALNPDGRAMWFRDKLVLGGLLPLDIDIPVAREAGILDVVQGPNMNVYCGRGVGGGSLVNLAMLVTPPRDILQRSMPVVNVDEMLSTYYPRALSVLRGNSVKRSFWENTPWYRYSRVGYAASKNAGFDAQFLVSGYDYDYMERTTSPMPWPRAA
jgi:cholesterol oxidase